MTPQRENTVFFEDIRNKRIFCCLSEPEEATKKLVIMCHGFKGTQTGPSRNFVDFSRLLVDNGYSALRFDQPNCGNSDGPFLDVSFNEWVGTIVALTEKYLHRGYAIGLLGESMGASAVAVASSQDRIRERVSAVLLWSPDPATTFDGDPAGVYEESGQKYRGQFWQEARDADIPGSLRTLKSDVHLVYGKHDDVVGREMDQVVDVVLERKGTLLILDGEGHGGWHEDCARMVFAEEIEKLNEWMF